MAMALLPEIITETEMEMDERRPQVPIFSNEPFIYSTLFDDESQYGKQSSMAFIDSLNDDLKNRTYFKAIKKAVREWHERGKHAVVLDIGMGSGLMSMMGIAAGADFAFACEIPVNKRKTVKATFDRHGFGDRIEFLNKSVQSLLLYRDVKRQPNIVVSEKFDSRLLRHDNINVMGSVQLRMLAPDCTYIPSTCNVYAQVVECDFIRKMSSIDPLVVDPYRVSINIPPIVKTCSKTTLYTQEIFLDGLVDSEVPFKTMSPVLKIFEIDWKRPYQHQRTSKMQFNVTESGRVDGIFSWWEMILDEDGEYMISNEPSWVTLFGKTENNWRYHWQQTVYHGQNSMCLDLGTRCYLESFHDQTRFWFRTSICPGAIEKDLEKGQHRCGCGIHHLYGTYKMGIMNDMERIQVFIRAMARVIVPGQTTCLCVGNVSLMPLIAQALGAARILLINTDQSVLHDGKKETRGVSDNDMDRCQFILRTLMGNQLLKNTRFVKLHGNYTYPIGSVDVVFGDPNLMGWQKTPNTCGTSKPKSQHIFNTLFEYSWFTLKYWNSMNLFNESLFHRSVISIPAGITFRAVCMKFHKLNRAATPIGDQCAGEFDMTLLDAKLESKQEPRNSYIEGEYLWQFKGVATSEPFDLLYLNFADWKYHHKSMEGSLTLQGETSAVALWTEWRLDDTNSVSTGPTEEIRVGSPVKWAMNFQQGVHFVQPNRSNGRLFHKACFRSNYISFNFSFRRHC